MNIVITGANGFIGHHLVKNLSTEHAITAVVRGSHKMGGHANKNITFKYIDLFNCDPRFFEDYDVIIHSAGTPVAKDSFKKNFLLTRHILGALTNSSCCPLFIFMSSYAVYGNRILPPIETDPLKPEDNYALSKMLSEILLEYCTRMAGINAITLRLGGVYGEGGNGIVNKILDSVKENRIITAFNILQKRNFVYVDDVCSIVLQLIKRPFAGYTIYNIGSDINMSIDELISCFGDNISVMKIENDAPNISYMLDNFKIKSVLNYQFSNVRSYIETELENLYGY